MDQSIQHPRVETAVVVSAIPARGVFFLRGVGGYFSAVALTTAHSGRQAGPRSQQCLMPGAVVTVLRGDSNTDPHAPTALILGPTSRSYEDDQSTLFYSGAMFHRTCGHVDLSHDGACVRGSKDELMAHDLSKGSSLDSVPGTWMVSTAFDGGLYISDYLSSLKSGAFSGVDLFHLDDKLRLSYDTLETRGLMEESQTCRLGHSLAKVESVYLNMREGAGRIGSGDTFQTVTAEKTDRLGVYRPLDGAVSFPYRQRLSGGLFEGSLDIVSAPTADGVYKADTDVAGLSMDENLDNGARVIRSATGISMVKTPCVPIPMVKQDLVGEANEDISFPDPAIEDDKLDALTMFGVDAYLLQESVREPTTMPLARSYADKVRNNSIDKALETLAKASGVAKDRLRPDYSLNSIGEASHMEMPSKGTVKTGQDESGSRSRTSRVFGGAAGMHTFPNGDVTIFGAHGEELRMSGGNIYLTCPGDMFVLPGRDLVQMAPRHAALKSIDGHLELHARKLATVASDQGLQMRAGASGTGAMVIESLSTYAMSPADHADEDKGLPSLNPVGGGLMIRSRGQTVLQTNDLTVGNVEGSRDPSNVFINSDKIGMACDDLEASVRSQASVVCASGAALGMGSNGIEARFSKLKLSGTSVAAGASSVTTAPFIDKEGKQTKVNLVSGKPGLFWDGSVRTSGNLRAQGFEALGDVQVVERKRWQEQLESDRQSAQGADVPLKKDDLAVWPVWLRSTDKMARAVINGLSLIFPLSKALGTVKFLLPLASWQRRLNSVGDLTIGGQEEYKTTGKPYPGKESWDGGEALADLGSEGEIIKKGMDEYGKGV